MPEHAHELFPLALCFARRLHCGFADGAGLSCESRKDESLEDALRDQLGLKLEAARMPIEVLVIQSVERPSEN